MKNCTDSRHSVHNGISLTRGEHWYENSVRLFSHCAGSLLFSFNSKKICAQNVRNTIGSEHKQWVTAIVSHISRSLTNTVSLSLSSVSRLYSYRRHPLSGFLRIGFASLISLALFLSLSPWNECYSIAQSGIFLKNRPLLQSWQIIFGSLSVVVFCAAFRAHCICVYSLTFCFNLFDEVYGSQYIYVAEGGRFCCQAKRRSWGTNKSSILRAYWWMGGGFLGHGTYNWSNFPHIGKWPW